jgi:hypothetical protein
MTTFTSMLRRRFLSCAGAALAYAALPLKLARALPPIGRRPKVPKPFSIPDYERNPFLRPIGLPFSLSELGRPTPPPQSGISIGGDRQ